MLDNELARARRLFKKKGAHSAPTYFLIWEKSLYELYVLQVVGIDVFPAGQN